MIFLQGGLEIWRYKLLLHIAAIEISSANVY